MGQSYNLASSETLWHDLLGIHHVLKIKRCQKVYLGLLFSSWTLAMPRCSFQPGRIWLELNNRCPFRWDPLQDTIITPIPVVFLCFLSQTYMSSLVPVGVCLFKEQRMPFSMSAFSQPLLESVLKGPLQVIQNLIWLCPSKDIDVSRMIKAIHITYKWWFLFPKQREGFEKYFCFKLWIWMPLPAAPASHTGDSLCPNCSASNLSPC